MPLSAPRAAGMCERQTLNRPRPSGEMDNPLFHLMTLKIKETKHEL